jgi:hypothetical protein
MYWMKKENIRPLATMEDPGIVEEEVKKVEKVAVEKVEKPVKSRKGAKKPAKGRDKGKRPPKDE